MNRTKMHRTGVALLVVLGSSVLMTGCWVSPRVVSQLTLERDMALRSLDTTVAELKKTRGDLVSLQQSKAGVGGELARTREEYTALRERVKSVEEANRGLESRVKSSRADYHKLKGTHSRLNQMAQVNLDQIASLRQLNENLLREKLQLEQDNTAQDRTITQLTRQVDRQRTELIRQSTEVQVARGMTPVVTPTSTGSQPAFRVPDNVDPLDAVNQLPLPVHFQLILSRAWDNLLERFDRTLEGKIVWDAVNIAMLCTLICLVLFGVAALAYFYRVRRMRRELRQYRAYLASKQRTGHSRGSETRYVVGEESSAAEADEESGYDEEECEEKGYERDVLEEPEEVAAATIRRQQQGQPRPEGFSPIFRTDPGEDIEDVAEAIQPVAPIQQESPRQRRVIGAVTERQQRMESARSDHEYKELPGVTQIIMPLRPDLAGQDASHGGDAEEIAVTEIMDKSSFDRVRESTGHGGSDEQELLDELKLIINKKLDPND